MRHLQFLVAALGLASLSISVKAATNLPLFKVDPALLGLPPLPSATPSIQPSPAEPPAEQPTQTVPLEQPSQAVPTEPPPQPAPAEKPVEPASPASPESAAPATPVPAPVIAPTPESGAPAQAQPAETAPYAAAPPAGEISGIPEETAVSPGVTLAPSHELAGGNKDDQTPTFLSAIQITGHQDKEMIAEGSAELRRRDQVITSDYLRYDQPEDQVSAKGNVRVRQNQDVMKGPELQLKLDTNQGYMTEPKYLLKSVDQPGHGDANKLVFLGKEHYKLDNARYTTCSVGDEQWYLNARELDINRTTQVATAHHAWVEFKGVPLLYTPWIDFPLNKQRKTGFLTPSFGTTGKGGAEFSVPFYWNIAPNYDATITPRVLAKRGVQINNEFRYLQPNYSGELHLDVLPNDHITQTTRSDISLAHRQDLGSGWSAGLNLEKVSDDNYFRDLSTLIANTSQTNLVRQGTLSYSNTFSNNSNLSISGLIQRFQTLQDPLAPVTPPYQRLPEITANYNKLDYHGLDFRGFMDYSNFNHPTLTKGQRLVLYPSVSYPMANAYGYITPKFGIHNTRYRLDSTSTTLPDSTRNIPILSVDSGVTFERPTTIGGKAMVQTLEPRLYYLYIPYRDQSQMPVFDSGEADFNFAQIFSENQFTGNDRINDANQLTFAVTSRFIDPANGQEQLRTAIGQRYYFHNQRVTLSSPARTTKTSDLLAAISGRVYGDWSLDGGWQYNPNQHHTQKLTLGTRYSPEIGKVLNLSYRLNRDTLKQFDVSAQWPIYGRWDTVARWNYSIRDHSLLEALAGVEYNYNCWSMRFVVHRFVTATQQTTNALFLQLELNGVSSLGTSPLDILRSNISGYSKYKPQPDETHPDDF